MSFWTLLTRGIILGLPAVVFPSAFKVFLISQALQNGWRKTLPACFVPILTDGPIILLMLFLLNQVPDWFLSGIQFVGGCFILYLAYRLARLVRAGQLRMQASEDAVRQSFWQAMGLNLLNPNPYLFSGLVLGPIAVGAAQANNSWFVGGAIFYGFYSTYITGVVLLIIAFARAGRVNPNLNYYLSVFAVFALSTIGIYQLYLALSRLLQPAEAAATIWLL